MCSYTYLDLLLIGDLREGPWVQLDLIWVVGAVQMPVHLGCLTVMVPEGRNDQN